MRTQMKFYLVMLLLTCGVLLQARVGIEISLNRSIYMRFEHIYACVTLRNDSGKPLLFGGDPALQGFLLFDIRDAKNRPVYARKDAEISITGLLLAPGEVRRMVFCIDRYYDLNRTGRFTIHAYVSHNALKNEYRSRDTFFDISDGVTVWKRTVGLPELEGRKLKVTDDERTYSIRTLTERKSIGYYLVVESDKKVYGVCRIGHVEGYEKFQVEIDMLSRLHLLMPVKSRIFHYLAFNSAGETLESSYWRTAETVPGLVRDSKTGFVRRMGGVPAREGVDFMLPEKNGRVSISQILDENEKKIKRPARYSGTIDLGKGVMADAPGSRNGE